MAGKVKPRRGLVSVGLLPDPVAGRLVVADPEIPIGILRAERRIRAARAVRATDASRVAPDDLRVVPAVLPRRTGVRRVVVVGHFARPGGDHALRIERPRRSVRRDVLSAHAAARVVGVVAAIRPRLRDGSGVA